MVCRNSSLYHLHPIYLNYETISVDLKIILYTQRTREGVPVSLLDGFRKFIWVVFEQKVADPRKHIARVCVPIQVTDVKAENFLVLFTYHAP